MGHILPTSFMLIPLLLLTSIGQAEVVKNILNTENLLNKYLLFLKGKEELMFIVTVLQVENLSILLLALTYFLNIFITLK